MRIWLTVREPQNSDRQTLYYYDLPQIQGPLPEYFWVSLAWGTSDDENSVNMTVDRSYLNMTDGRFETRLRDVVVDPPESFTDDRHSEGWRSEVSGTAGELHASLRTGGWQKY
jgi:hypothetical protein